MRDLRERVNKQAEQLGHMEEYTRDSMPNYWPLLARTDSSGCQVAILGKQVEMLRGKAKMHMTRRRFLALIGSALSAPLVNCQPVVPEPRSASEPRAFGHWHHSAQRAVGGANTLEAYGHQVRLAKAMGVAGFQYNVVNVSLEIPELDVLYEAAAAEGDFYLFPSADMSWNMSEADFDTLANYNRDHPNRLYVEGKPLVTVYGGDNVHD